MKRRGGSSHGAATSFSYSIFSLEFRHFNRHYGTFVALVSESSAGAFLRLLQGVGGEQAVDDGNLALGVEAGDAVGDTLADVVEMGRFATDDAAEDNHGVVTSVQAHLVGSVDELKAARNGLYVDVFGQRAVLFERGDGSFEQGSRDFRIPFRHHDAEAHVAGVGHLRKVVVAQVSQ